MITFISLCALLLDPVQSLAVATNHTFLLETGQIYSLTMRPLHPVRVTTACFWGRPQITVVINSQQKSQEIQGLFQIQLGQDAMGKDVKIIIKGPGVGIIRNQSVERFSLLRHGQEEIFSLGVEQKRVFEVHPKIKDNLIVERIQGNVTFQASRCQKQAKNDCYHRLQRTQPIVMHNYWQNIALLPCSDCLILIQAHAHQQSVLRISINATITILAQRPALSLVHKAEQTVFIVYGPPLSKGRIVTYSGVYSPKVSSSQLVLSPFQNGFEFKLSQEHNISSPIAITIIGRTESSYLSVQSPSEGGNLHLVDGRPTTVQIEPHNNFTLQFHSIASGHGNFHLSGKSSFLSTLLIRFINLQTGSNYTIRPKFIFDSQIASQSFKLGNDTGDVAIIISSSAHEPGYLNLSANSQERLILPLDWPHSAILEHRQSHFYFVGGTQELQLIIAKCVECHLQVTIRPQGGELCNELMLQRQLKKIVRSPKGQLFIDIYTNHYAFYSILIKRKKNNSHNSNPLLKNKNVKAYLTEPNNYLEIEFNPPFCSNGPCSNVKYLLVEGSDPRHVAARAYCPNILFDFDERTKDISVQEILPQKTDTGSLFLVRPLFHRDWLVVVVEAKGEVLSYEMLNVGEMREYSGMRWPLFYLLMFVTLAVFLSVVLMVGLRRRRLTSGGYIRASSQCSAQAFD